MTLLIVLVLLTALSVETSRRLGLLSPAAFGLAFVVLNLALLAIQTWMPGFFDGVRGTSFPLEDGYDSVDQVAIAYFLVGAALWLGGVGVARVQSGLTLGAVLQHVERRTVHRVALATAVLLWLICLTHLLSMDLGLLWRSRHYLQLATAEGAGISNPVATVAHLVMGPIGLLSAGATVIFLSHRRPGLAVMFGFVAAYALAIALAQSSRWAPMVIFGLLATEVTINRRLWAPRLLWARLLLVMVMLLAYTAVLNGRSAGAFGLAYLMDNLFTGDAFSFGRTLQTFLLNIGHGALLLAEVLDHGQHTYDQAYKLLSFSPLPSFLDGWREVVHAQNRVNLFTPYSAIAETLLFGPGYFLIFLVYLFTISAVSCRVLYSSNRLSELALLGPVYFVLIAVHFYPLRNSFRLAVAVMLLGLTLRYMPRLRFRWGPAS